MRRKNLKIVAFIFLSFSILFFIGCVVLLSLRKGKFFFGVYPILFFSFLSAFGICGAISCGFFYAVLGKKELKKTVCPHCKKSSPIVFDFCPFCGGKKA